MPNIGRKDCRVSDHMKISAWQIIITIIIIIIIIIIINIALVVQIPVIPGIKNKRRLKQM